MRQTNSKRIFLLISSFPVSWRRLTQFKKKNLAFWENPPHPPSPIGVFRPQGTKKRISGWRQRKDGGKFKNPPTLSSVPSWPASRALVQRRDFWVSIFFFWWWWQDEDPDCVFPAAAPLVAGVVALQGEIPPQLQTCIYLNCTELPSSDREVPLKPFV